MEKWIDKIFSLKSFPGKLIFVIWISAVVIILLPDNLLQKFLLKSFREKFSDYIGPTLLISSGIIIYMAYQALKDFISHRIFRRRFKRNILKSLNYLNWNEIIVIREFFIQSKDTIKAPFGNETVISLENKRLIYKAASSAVVGYDFGFPYSINEIVKENMTLKILQLDTGFNEMNQQEIDKVWGERPDWAKDMERRANMFKNLW